ncbi:MAG: hypothetical protein AAF492_16205, partial [Verrucomicrobiota bacterium]
MAAGQEFTIKQISPTDRNSHTPAISETETIVFQMTPRDGELGGDHELRVWGPHVHTPISAMFKVGVVPLSEVALDGDTVVWIASEDKRVEETSWSLRRPSAQLPAVSDEARRQRLAEKNTEVYAWTFFQGAQRYTLDPRADEAANVKGSRIVWQKSAGEPFGREIMLLDGDTRLQLTTNLFQDVLPQLDNNHVVWHGYDGEDWDIFFYDIARRKKSRMTSNNHNDLYPRIWEGQVVWEARRGTGRSGIFYQRAPGRRPRVLAFGDHPHRRPRIHGRGAVWQAHDGNDFEIFFHDLSSAKAVQVTDNDYDDFSPEISGEIVTWMAYAGSGEADIFVWSLSTSEPLRLTDNEVVDQHPKIAGGS